MTVDDLNTETIRKRLAMARGTPLADPYPAGYFSTPPRAASVLLPLYWDEEWKLLFIRRSHNDDDRHSGQVAFPGGRVDPHDADETAAALREAHEEIGLEERDVTVLGQLSSYRTVSNYLVTPVVAEINWPLTFRLDPTEVSRVFSIPLSWLAEPQNRRINQRHLHGFDVSMPVHYYERYDDELLWGVTAKITVGFLQLLGVMNAET
ncbi:MAG: CoA pyrophosphatase [Sedimenticola sp.]